MKIPSLWVYKRPISPTRNQQAVRAVDGRGLCRGLGGKCMWSGTVVTIATGHNSLRFAGMAAVQSHYLLWAHDSLAYLPVAEGL